MPLRPLSKEHQKIAEEELNEVPSQVQENLDHIKDWISKQPHLNCRLDDEWLICFLRMCKYSLEKTKQKLDSYYTIRTADPQIFWNRDPFSAEIQQYISIGNIFPLPKSDNPNDPRTFLNHSPSYNPDTMSPVPVVKAYFMSLDALFHIGDYITGQQALINLEAVDYKAMLHMPPSLLHKAFTYLVKAYPIRIKKIYFINTPPIFESTIKFLKSCASDKLSQRIHVYNRKQLFEIQKFIPLSILPKEYGGTAGTVLELADKWKAELENCADWFKEEDKYGVDENKRLDKSNEDVHMMGIEGSFRTLTID